MLAIADSIDAGRIKARIGLVMANKADAKGLVMAKERGIETLVVPTKKKCPIEYEDDMVDAFRKHKVTLVCLAGYMRLVGFTMLEAFPNRILNIHPALLPSFPGDHAHRDTLNHGVKISGCTVHLVDKDVDNGPIVVQKAVEVDDSDTEETLSARILKQEWVAYTEAINKVLSNDYEVVGRRFLLKG